MILNIGQKFKMAATLSLNPEGVAAILAIIVEAGTQPLIHSDDFARKVIYDNGVALK